MRAAIRSAIRSVDPTMLERVLGEKVSVLNLNRKAKLWDLFVSYHDKLLYDTEDDFNEVFGRDIRTTYLARLKRLRGG